MKLKLIDFLDKLRTESSKLEGDGWVWFLNDDGSLRCTDDLMFVCPITCFSRKTPGMANLEGEAMGLTPHLVTRIIDAADAVGRCDQALRQALIDAVGVNLYRPYSESPQKVLVVK